MIKQTPGVKTVTMTTNGVALAEQAGKLKEAGLDGVNVSLDTLDREEFAAWTGRDSLEQVLDGIRTVQELGIPMKLNAVLAGAQSCEKPETAALLTGIQRCEKLIAFAQEYGLCLRFIEMMPIGYGSQYACRETQDLLNELEKRYGRAEPLERKVACYGSGPAVYYHFEKLQQPVGLIRAIHESFCAGCNRVRLTAEGRLKLCLCYEDSVDLRAVLRSGQTDGDLADSIREAVWRKPAQHCFGESKGITEKELMGRIGG
jgi:cyclic pyranopterin phosphate synthase